MNRIPPSQKIRNKTEELLNQGLGGDGDVSSLIVHLGVERLVHELLERSFLEERRRTKVLPRFITEKSCIKLVFATLWRTSQRWHGVKMSELERQQLIDKPVKCCIIGMWPSASFN